MDIEEKKAIDYFKRRISNIKKAYINIYFKVEKLQLLLNLIEKQQEQLQEKDKEIESAYWKGYIERENMSKEICLTGCKYRKEYFTKKASEE